MLNAKAFFGWVAVITALAVLLGLGSWQLVRRAEKHDLIARIEARMAATPVTLPAKIDDVTPWDYRRVRVTGHFLHNKEILLAGRVQRGMPGYHVITPLVRDDGSAVLVNRGWIPADRIDPYSRAEGQMPGTVTIGGIARVPAARGLFTPDNDPGRGFWIVPDPAAMARETGVGPVPNLVVEADSTPNPGGYPKGGVSRLTLTDNHLQYALTWYSLALVLVVVVLVYRRRQARFPEI